MMEKFYSLLIDVCISALKLENNFIMMVKSFQLLVKKQIKTVSCFYDLIIIASFR